MKPSARITRRSSRSVWLRQELRRRGNDAKVSWAALHLVVIAVADAPLPTVAQLHTQRPWRGIVFRGDAEQHTPRRQAVPDGRGASQPKHPIRSPLVFTAEQHGHVWMSRDVPARHAVGPGRDEEG